MNDSNSVLMPPPDIKGGLIKQKKNPNASEHLFKAPEPVSLLGLDKLAEAKRQERKRKEAETIERSRIHSFKDDDNQEDVHSSKRLTNPEIEGQK
jgi:hypothetical protein